MVVTERISFTGIHHLVAVAVVALSAPVVVGTIIVILVLLNRRRWLTWKKRSRDAYLSKVSVMPVPVHRQQSELTSQLLQQALQPADARWQLNPAMYVVPLYAGWFEKRMFRVHHTCT